MVARRGRLTRAGGRAEYVGGLELVRERPASYGSRVRTHNVATLPRPLGRVLDIGCATGAGADLLRASGATHLAGVEIDPTFAREAETRYDEVVCKSAEHNLPWERSSFDTVLCYDVLEHLYDPWTLVRRLHALLTPEGQIDVSIPNLRYREALLPLAFKGIFAYQPSGVLDVTHVRFFTRRSAEELLTQAGYQVTRVSGSFSARKDRLAARLTFGKSAEFSVRQWYVTALA